MSLFKGTSHNNIAISLPALLFFRSYNEVFVQHKRHLFPTTSAQIDFVCVLCTSSSTAAVASLSLPLSLCVSLFKGTSQQYRHFSTYPFIFSQLQRNVCTNGITSLLARIIFRFVTTGLILCTPLYATKTFSPLTGGCSEGLQIFL